MVKKVTTEDFIRKAISVHGNRYNYDLVIYKTVKEKIKIICAKHGEFLQLPSNHLANMGCVKCAHETISNKRKGSRDQFIEKANKIHNNLYSYDSVDYKDCKSKVSIICKIHGKFTISPSNHLTGSGCQACGRTISNNNQKISTCQFIKKAKKIHGLKYDYDKVDYINNKTNVIISCKIHGDFSQAPINHINRQGCPQCGILISAAKHVKPINNFIEKAKIVHGDRYDYSDTKHLGNRRFKTSIKCLQCNKVFEQSLANHLRGAGCPDCARENCSKALSGRKGRRVSKEYFIKKSISVHGNKYDYSKSEYKTSRDKVLIYCPEHNTNFYIKPEEFYQGTTACKGCYSTESHGERKIRLWLENNKFQYEEEKKFESCRINKNGIMRFDFYLPECNLLIEYDGRQHFKPAENPAWRGNPIIKFIQTQQRDKFKNNWAKDNNIELLRISYKDYKNIDIILSSKLLGVGCG